MFKNIIKIRLEVNKPNYKIQSNTLTTNTQQNAQA